ncbi:MAG: hypothetical protein GY898_27350 [Proteobacteria bacterium]|nr:hypothetical protein [Pseudomonadota bacterium]
MRRRLGTSSTSPAATGRRSATRPAAHWDAFAELKAEHDPDGLFGNQFWSQYGPARP